MLFYGKENKQKNTCQKGSILTIVSKLFLYLTDREKAETFIHIHISVKKMLVRVNVWTISEVFLRINASPFSFSVHRNLDASSDTNRWDEVKKLMPKDFGNCSHIDPYCLILHASSLYKTECVISNFYLFASARRLGMAARWRISLYRRWRRPPAAQGSNWLKLRWKYVFRHVCFHFLITIYKMK